MNFEPEVIRARFVEAAFTERYLPRPHRPESGGYWPSFIHDAEDRKGWDDQAVLENASQSGGRASSGAITRHQECMDWTTTLIPDKQRRHIIWAWAFCRANGWDFGAKCSRRGWARPTAYRRLTASIEAISEHFRMESVFVALPDDKWLRHETADMPSNGCKVANHVTALPAIPFAPSFRTERSTDMLTSPEAVADFGEYLQRTNSERAKANERRRRALCERGVA